MAKLTANWAVGYTDKEQTHNAAIVRQVILGDAMASLMYGGDTNTRRFASTVLNMISFADGAIGETDASKGDTAIHSTMKDREIDHLHKKLKQRIYAENLTKPFMTDDELASYLVEQILEFNNRRDCLDLLTQDVEKTFGVRL